MNNIVLVGIGSNISDSYGNKPDIMINKAICAISLLPNTKITAISSLWKNAPVPYSTQDWYYNSVINLATSIPAVMLVGMLIGIEAGLGRMRTSINAPRIIDLDLLSYKNLINTDPSCIIPHPRLEERSFVLLPIQEIFPNWHHPYSKLTIKEMIANLNIFNIYKI